jgi:hypothetical protein
MPWNRLPDSSCDTAQPASLCALSGSTCIAELELSLNTLSRRFESYWAHKLTSIRCGIVAQLDLSPTSWDLRPEYA